MSKGLEAWRKVYYRKPASDVRRQDAIAHSLRKWRGLRPEVLKRYGIRLERPGKLVDPSGACFFIDAGSCALCVHYEGRRDCRTSSNGPCPLVTVLGDSCDAIPYGPDHSPYHAFTSNGDPEPMIRALEEALTLEKAERAARRRKSS